MSFDRSFLKGNARSFFANSTVHGLVRAFTGIVSRLARWKLIGTFCVCSLWFSRSFNSFSLPYTIIKFLFASLKLFTSFLHAYWNPPQNFLLCDSPMSSSANLSLASRENVQEITSHRRLPVSIFIVKIADLMSVKQVTGRISKLVSNFKGAS
jgi:hypothetical protein